MGWLIRDIRFPGMTMAKLYLLKLPEEVDLIKPSPVSGSY